MGVFSHFRGVEFFIAMITPLPLGSAKNLSPCSRFAVGIDPWSPPTWICLSLPSSSLRASAHTSFLSKSSHSTRVSILGGPVHRYKFVCRFRQHVSYIHHYQVNVLGVMVSEQIFPVPLVVGSPPSHMFLEFSPFSFLPVVWLCGGCWNQFHAH